MSHAVTQTPGPSARPAPWQGNGPGLWAVLVSVASVLATFAASFLFFQGFLGIAALPGDIPPINQIPVNDQTRHPLALMHAGELVFVVAAVLALVGLVGGVVLSRRADSFRKGVWAMALAGCTPVLAVMLLAGMGAT